MQPPPPLEVSHDKELEALKKSDDTTAELPFEPCAFAFRDISYNVITPDKEELELLKNVTGFFEPGTMTALMGRLVIDMYYYIFVNIIIIC